MSSVARPGTCPAPTAATSGQGAQSPPPQAPLPSPKPRDRRVGAPPSGPAAPAGSCPLRAESGLLSGLPRFPKVSPEPRRPSPGRPIARELEVFLEGTQGRKAVLSPSPHCRPQLSTASLPSWPTRGTARESRGLPQSGRPRTSPTHSSLLPARSLAPWGIKRTQTERQPGQPSVPGDCFCLGGIGATCEDAEGPRASSVWPECPPRRLTTHRSGPLNSGSKTGPNARRGAGGGPLVLPQVTKCPAQQGPWAPPQGGGRTAMKSSRRGWCLSALRRTTKRAGTPG